MTHEITIKENHIPAGEGHADIDYWWACSCGKRGPSKHKRWHAQSGGKTHVRKATP